MQHDHHYRIRPDYADPGEEEVEEAVAGGVPRWLVPLLGGLILAAAAYWWWAVPEIRLPAAPDEVATVELAGGEPAVSHPLPGPRVEGREAEQEDAPARDFGPLPTLDDSDSALQGILGQLAGQLDLGAYLVPRNLVRKFVVTIDNLPGRRIPQQYLPIRRPAGTFKVREVQDNIVLDSANFARYTPFIDLLADLESRDIADLYVHFYPLFQEAYEELGYPGQYFNDRMIEAIDDLLATPEIQGPIPLKQPSVYYQFADPELEALPAGQKLLVRMGPDNAARVKEILREIRAFITAG